MQGKFWENPKGIRWKKEGELPWKLQRKIVAHKMPKMRLSMILIDTYCSIPLSFLVEASFNIERKDDYNGYTINRSHMIPFSLPLLFLTPIVFSWTASVAMPKKRFRFLSTFYRWPISLPLLSSLASPVPLPSLRFLPIYLRSSLQNVPRLFIILLGSNCDAVDKGLQLLQGKLGWVNLLL